MRDYCNIFRGVTCSNDGGVVGRMLSFSLRTPVPIVYISLSALLHFFRPCGSHVTESWKILWFLPLAGKCFVTTTVREIPRHIFAMSTCMSICMLDAPNVRLPHSEVFTVNRSNKRKYAPQSDCNNRKWDYCYLFNGKREATSVEQWTHAITYTYLVCRQDCFIIWTVNLEFDIYKNANFERINLFFLQLITLRSQTN